jgi:outer membrane receptor protein involved in Fe transport
MVSAYDMFISDDIITYITAQNTREAVNAGETRHRGIETSVSVALPYDLRADVAYSTSSQRYVTWTPRAGESYGGKLMEQAPKTLGNVLLTYAPSVLHGGRVSCEWVWVGSYQLDPQNTHTYDGYRLVNLHVAYKPLPSTELFVKALNLTNRNYSEVVSYDQFQGARYQAGSPRAVYAGVRLTMVH